MIQELRKSMAMITSSVDVILIFSLWVGLLSSLLGGVKVLGAPTLSGLIQFAFFALYAAQLVTFERRIRAAWVLSALQTVSILFFSIGTFGYVLAQVLKPVSSYQPEQAYLLAGLLLATEAWKTIYFYRVCKN
jgi:hypothetical protein